MHRRTCIALSALIFALSIALPVSSAPQRPAAPSRGAEIKFDGIGLAESIDFLRDLTGANIHVQWKALEEVGVTRDAPVNVHFRSLTLGKALTLILSSASGKNELAFVSDGNVIEITTRALADKKLYTRVYPVDDLLLQIPDFDDAPATGLANASSSGRANAPPSKRSNPNEKSLTRAERAEDLVTLIRETIRPDIWRENGGPASIRCFRGNLVITAPQSVHEAIGK